MEHTANTINPNKGIIPSLIKIFTMFEFCLIDYKDKLDTKAIICINSKEETGLYFKNSTFEEIITKVVLNAILHHVGMSWIISSNDERKYEIDKSDHQYWLNKVPWYNTATCSRLHGSLIEFFLKHARTDRYNLMCSLVTHEKKPRL